jgi:hypothetical protein
MSTVALLPPLQVAIYEQSLIYLVYTDTPKISGSGLAVAFSSCDLLILLVTQFLQNRMCERVCVCVSVLIHSGITVKFQCETPHIRVLKPPGTNGGNKRIGVGRSRARDNLNP